jgi:hypothetical protein
MPRVRAAVRPRWLIGSLAVILAVGAACAHAALRWVGRPFAGLLFADNLIVVSIGSASWRDPQLRRTEWSRIMAVDGVPVHSARVLLDTIAARQPGEQLTYTLARDDETFRVAIPVRTFGWTDFREIFAPMLAVGTLLPALAGGALVLRPGSAQLRALFAVCAAIGVAILTGPDQYGPYHFTWLYLLAIAAVPPAILQLAAAYPWRPDHRVRRAVGVAWAVFLTIGVALVLLRAHASAFLALLYVVYFALANAALLYGGSLVAALVVRRRPRAQLVVALAAVLLAAAPGAVVLIVYPLMTEPIAPAWMLLPVLLLPVLSGVAFVALTPRSGDGVGAPA